MSSVNKVILVGNAGADPEIRRTQSGSPIANLRIATSETWRDRNSGERKEKTEWHNVVIFSEGLCKVIEQYVKKGSKLYLEGSLQTRKWQDQAGNDRYSTEVVLQGFNCALTLLDGRKDDDAPADRSGGDYASSSGRGQPETETRNSYGGAPAGRSRDMDDEIPFAPEWR